jgi:hypothetical protein
MLNTEQHVSIQFCVLLHKSLFKTQLFLFPSLKSVLKGQHFTSTDQVTAKVAEELTVVSRNASKIFTNVGKTESLPNEQF